MARPRIAVHKFSSCDGCQLALLNLGDELLALNERVEIVHFLEAGPSDPEAQVDIAFVEGSISTPEELERIGRVRANSAYLVTIGACATSGGLQALRNLDRSEPAWRAAIYARPEFIASLPEATPVSDHVAVDLELWGCPIDGRQIVSAIASLLHGVPPVEDHDKVCLECKRQGIVCTLVAQDTPCMGALTRTGCGALCPSFGRACYACYGPAENPNGPALGNRLEGLGLTTAEVARQFLFIHSGAKGFGKVGRQWRQREAGDD